MKLAEDLIRLLSDEIKQIPKRYIYIGLVLYFGMWMLVSLIYVIDWVISHGDRAELLILLDKL